jgi:hypothetical protein
MESQEEKRMTVRFKFFGWLAASTIALQFLGSVHATSYRIEPDDYAEGANLNDINAVVDLRLYNGFIVSNFPAQFGVFPDPEVAPITANENPDVGGGYYTSTGTKSFGHADIPFFNETAQLGMHFLVPASQVTIDFIGRNSLSDAIGVLEIYSPQGTLLDTFTSSPITTHQIVTMSFSRGIADIGYARAFSSPDADPFGALDNLRFVTGAPTPLTGDFNSDGKVDAADYVVWRNGLGTTHTQAQYQQWRQNFGASGGAGSSTNSAVPEPGSYAAIALVTLLLNRIRSSRQRATLGRRSLPFRALA